MKKRLIPYDPKLKVLTEEVGNNATLGKVMLWKKLRNKQLMSYDFHKQKPLLSYIVDFDSNSLRVVCSKCLLLPDKRLSVWVTKD